MSGLQEGHSGCVLNWIGVGGVGSMGSSGMELVGVVCEYFEDEAG